MTRNCSNHRPQTSPCHHEEGAQKVETHRTVRTQFKKNKQLFLSQQAVCKTKKDITNFITKAPYPMGATTNYKSTTT